MKDSLSAHSVRGTANPASVLLITIIKSNTAKDDEIAGLMFFVSRTFATGESKIPIIIAIKIGVRKNCASSIAAINMKPPNQIVACIAAFFTTNSIFEDL